MRAFIGAHFNFNDQNKEREREKARLNYLFWALEVYVQCTVHSTTTLINKTTLHKKMNKWQRSSFGRSI